MIGEVPRAAWLVVTAAAGVVSVPGSVELLLVSTAAIAGRRQKPSVEPLAPWKVAIVVPAHDEEGGIGDTVRSLLAVDRQNLMVDLYVVADNCSDDTALVAQREGAKVLVRNDRELRGKGYALHFAFTQLLPLGYDCALVIDADTAVSASVVTAAVRALQQGAAGVQVRYLMKTTEESPRTRLRNLALRAFNVVRPTGREALGLSVGLLGNGFALTRETLEAVPYLASSIVEDLEYHLSIVRSGRRVAFASGATVYGEMPAKGAGVKTQRARWEGGRLRMMMDKAPPLALEVLSGRFRLLEPLLELLLLPLSFHSLILLIAVLSPSAVVRDIGLAGVGILLLHLVAAASMEGGGWQDITALLRAPFYVAWKIVLIPSLLRSARSNQSWIRTSRDPK
jgi:cellulose synthase/poly-beta-1,6-N-acetylglucosamine synthase-like glycosyltransferase